MTAIGGVAMTIIYAALELLISLLLNGSIWIAKNILDSSITVFSGDADFFTVMGSHFLSLSSLSAVVESVAIGLILLQLVLGVIRSWSSPMIGENAESAWNVLVRCIISIFLIVLFFKGGTTRIKDGVFTYTYDTETILVYLGRMFSSILAELAEPFRTASAAAGFGNITVSFSGIGMNHIAIIILLGAMLGSVLGAAVTYVERMLTFWLYVQFGPVFLALFANRNTQDVAKQWILGLGTQFGAIFISLMLWVMFLNNYVSLHELGGGLFSEDNSPIFFLRIATCIAILALIQNSEKILNSVGLRTMPNHETVSMAAKGVGAFMAGLGFARSTGKAASQTTVAKAASTAVWNRLGNTMIPFSRGADGYGKTINETSLYKAIDAQRSPSMQAKLTENGQGTERPGRKEIPSGRGSGLIQRGSSSNPPLAFSTGGSGLSLRTGSTEPVQRYNSTAEILNQGKTVSAKETVRSLGLTTAERQIPFGQSQILFDSESGKAQGLMVGLQQHDSYGNPVGDPGMAFYPADTNGPMQYHDRVIQKEEINEQGYAYLPLDQMTVEDAEALFQGFATPPLQEEMTLQDLSDAEETETQDLETWLRETSETEGEKE